MLCCQICKLYFFIGLIVESFKKIFMRYFIISNIIVYYTIVILNILDKVANCIEIRVVKS